MHLLDLGDFSGDVWLFGGPYSNLQATRAFLALAAQAGGPVDGPVGGQGGARPICTGDVVGYGAEAQKVLKLVAANAHVIAGNVERQLARGAGDCGCGFAPGTTCETLSQGWYAHADAQVGPKWREWMDGLADMAVFTHLGRRYGVVHGGASDISRFLWPCSPECDFRTEIALVTGLLGPIDGIIAGHSGLAFERIIDGVHWINAGVIGLPPHDGRAQTRFGVLKQDGVHFQRLHYDHLQAAGAMRAAGLGNAYAETLETGIWPSEDVLPPALRRGGGFAG